jgi:hypothetical protein
MGVALLCPIARSNVDRSALRTQSHQDRRRRKGLACCAEPPGFGGGGLLVSRCDIKLASAEEAAGGHLILVGGWVSEVSAHRTVGSS